MAFSYWCFARFIYFVAPNGEGGFGKAGVVGGGGVFTSEYVPIEES
jgi:hypothetical protein